MKLTNIDLYSNRQPVANFSFRDPTSQNPYIVMGIYGLDADEIIPKYAGRCDTSNKQHFDLVLKKREVVIRMALNPRNAGGKSYSDLRDQMYRAVESSRDGTIQLRFNNGSSNVAALAGFVTKFETTLFENKPQLQITLLCSKPMLTALEPHYVDVSTLGDSFTIMDTLSTAKHGFKFSLTISDDTSPLDAFVMQDYETPTWSFSVTPLGGFEVGDILYVSSEPDTRDVYIERDSVKIPLGGRIDAGSAWPMIYPMANNFLITPSGITWNELTYYPTYWGV